MRSTGSTSNAACHRSNTTYAINNSEILSILFSICVVRQSEMTASMLSVGYTQTGEDFVPGRFYKTAKTN